MATPRQITMATGSEGGYYDALGKHLKKSLERAGVDLILVPTAGSRENLQAENEMNGADGGMLEQSGIQRTK